MPNGNIFPTNYVQMLKAIVVEYTIKTCMSNIWQLSVQSGLTLNPFKVEAVTTAVGNSFHRWIADGKNDCWRHCIID
jgi:hypothetical protein